MAHLVLHSHVFLTELTILNMHRTSTVYDSAYFGEGSGRTWMDDVNCAGHESRLVDCGFSCWECEDCSHSEDVGVRCGMLRIPPESRTIHANKFF